MDERVFIVVESDRIPSIGELFYLSREDDILIENQIKESFDNLNNYRKWLYGKSSKKSHDDSEEEITEEDKENISIGDAVYVSQVALKYNENMYQSHVEIDSINPIKDLY